MRFGATIAIAFVLGFAAITPLPAYYHYIHYTGRNAADGPVPEKYDLTALPNKTLTFFVSDVGPTQYPSNDSLNSVISQIRQAVATWNSVGTSDLRIAFGGFYTPGADPRVAPGATPGANVVFEDLAPGFYGMGAPTVRADPAVLATQNFLPILKSTVYLTNNLNQKPGPSYAESFFLTTIHEMGHSLGLQHTYTSSAMSTVATRATALTRPIDADDIAGISVLYPAPAFAAQTGSITGKITANGSGVHMASVVAIRNGFGAVSALTNPDGSFRIDGVPPGQYYVYAHPLPPQTTSSCADICAPLDLNSQPILPSGPFNTVFYPGVTSFVQASSVGVAAGNTTDLGNLSVRPRSDVPIYGVTIFSFFPSGAASNVVSPGFLNLTASGPGNVVAGGSGLASNGTLTKGLQVVVMGGGASVYGIAPYVSNNFTYVNAGFSYSLGATPGPQHLIFSVGDFIYILPSAVSLVTSGPPSVTSVAANGDGSVAMSGTNLVPDSLIYFDGLPAAVRSLDVPNQRAVVIPPAGASGQNATVTIFNHDGQNSLFLQAAAPPTFSYGTAGAPSFTFSPAALPAGSEAAVTITGANTQFGAGQTFAGFGSNDVYVRNVIVTSPTQLLVNVSIPLGAPPAATEASVITGFQIAARPQAFQITPPVPRQPSVVPVLKNVIAGQTGAYPGAYVSLSGVNLNSAGGSPTVTVNGAGASVVAATADQITIQVPSSLKPGPAILGLNNGAADSFPVAVTIDAPAPVITAVQDAGNTPFDGGRPAHGGNVVKVLLSGFADASAVIYPPEVTINVGEVNHTSILVTAAPGGLYEVRFVLSNLVPAGPRTPITVYLDGRSSLTSFLNTSNQ